MEHISTAKRRILLVDDDEISLYCLKLILEEEGYEVATANDVPSALALAGTSVPDLLVTDISLKNASGTELVEKLRIERDLPAIAISGYDADQLAEQSSVRFSGHVTKPVDHTKLVRLIAQVLGAQPAARPDLQP